MKKINHIVRNRQGASFFYKVACLIVCIISPALSASELEQAAAETLPGSWTVLNVGGDQSGFSKELLDVSGDSIFNYADRGIWNKTTRKLTFIGQGHIREMRHITYSEATNQWRAEPKSPWDCTPDCEWGGIGHAYHHVAGNPENGDLYVRKFNGQDVHKYSRAENSWSLLPAMPLGNVCCAALEYFPELNGLIVAGRSTLLIYRESSGEWSVLAQDLTMGPYHNVAYYHPTEGAVYFGGGVDSSDLYKIDADEQIQKLKNAPQTFGINQTINVIDPATGHLLIFENESTGYEYSTTEDLWRSFDPKAPHLNGSNPTGHTMATAITTHGVILMARRFDTPTVYVYRHAESDLNPGDIIQPMPPADLNTD